MEGEVEGDEEEGGGDGECVAHRQFQQLFYISSVLDTPQQLLVGENMNNTDTTHNAEPLTDVM